MEMELIDDTKKKILMEIAKEPSHGYKLALNLTLPLSTVYERLQDLKELDLIEHKTKERQIKVKFSLEY